MMMDTSTTPSPRQNQLLGCLSERDYRRLLPFLELVPMPIGMTVSEAGKKMRHVYFPTTCIVSLINFLKDGSSAEYAITGNDGAVGVTLFLGGAPSPSWAIVLSSGYAYRIRADVIKKVFDDGGSLHQLLLRYMQSLFMQTGQVAVCNRYHSVEQQLCRRLLMSLDRLPSNELAITQELIAHRMGVRREGITEAAGNLQKAGLIQCSRGHITVLDRRKLQARACECYAAIKEDYDALFVRSVAEPAGRLSRFPARFIEARGCGSPAGL